MRQPQQVIDQLLDFARAHDDIRAVVMNGSRANPNAPKDLFNDYDVVYYVADPLCYKADQSWIACFGERVIVQQNDIEEPDEQGYIFLMLFQDGVRIDLMFNQVDKLQYVGSDTLTIVLLDKDGRIPPLPPPSDTGYRITRPSQKKFDETINEIFWCSNNMAKGIWRDELPYVRHMFDAIIRPCILDLLAWYAADQHDWTINTGGYGRWLKRFLPSEVWAAYLRTYAGTTYEQIWDALFEALQLTRQCGTALAYSLGYAYPLEDDRRMLAYLQHVRALPTDARSFEDGGSEDRACEALT
jgi:aminoglycoside 6-adenylyltransferase